MKFLFVFYYVVKLSECLETKKIELQRINNAESARGCGKLDERFVAEDYSFDFYVPKFISFIVDVDLLNNFYAKFLLLIAIIRHHLIKKCFILYTLYFYKF